MESLQFDMVKKIHIVWGCQIKCKLTDRSVQATFFSWSLKKEYAFEEQIYEKQ